MPKSISMISLYLQHHLLWFNDKHPSDEWWDKKNLEYCYKELLKDLKQELRTGRVANYFERNTNLLEHQEQSMLNRLAVKIQSRIEEL